MITELVGRNAIRLQPSDHFNIHPIVHVSHTATFKEQHPDIEQSVQERSEPIPAVYKPTFEVDEILNHLKRGKYQFLTLMKGKSSHDARCKPP